MAFSVPTLNEFVRISENKMSSAFGGESSVLRKSVTKVIARVFAAVAYLVVLMLQKMWRNSFVTSCDVETLLSNGVDFDLPNKPEGYARGRIIVGSENVYARVLQGTIFSTPSGEEFEVVADVVLSGGINGTPVGIIAIEPGEKGNLSAGTELNFRDVEPEGVKKIAFVDSQGLVGGVRIEVLVNGNIEYWGETVEQYRERILNFKRNQPCGGSDNDYKSWAERFGGVSRCVPLRNCPHVGAVTCVLVHYGDDDHIAVNEAVVSEVRDYVADDVRRPVTADVRIVSCTEKRLNFEIKIKPNNSDVQKSVMDSLRIALRNYKPGEFVANSSLTAELKSSSSAEEVAVYKVNGSTQGFSLAKSEESGYEQPVVDGEVTWSSYADS